MKNSRIDLRFYFITDDGASGPGPLEQAKIAIAAGATVVQYRNKAFSAPDFNEAEAIAHFCAIHGVPFIVNDDMILARALGADGVHLGQQDADPALARQILGPAAIVGVSVADLEELSRTDTAQCDYLGTGPVFATGTKADAGDAIGLGGLAEVARQSGLPVVAIGGIFPESVGACMESGADGVAVISAITRADDPAAAAARFAAASGTRSRVVQTPWQDEFLLIRRILGQPGDGRDPQGLLRVGAGDDAALLSHIARPVITTDTQHENIHFRRFWQSFFEIGYKAAETAFSDLAACYAFPLALFVNLSLPATVSRQGVMEIYEGIRASLAPCGAVLGGGNVSSAQSLAIDMFVVGSGHAGIFPVRSAAAPGHGLYVTGPLGRARAGLECLMRGDYAFPGLIEAFKRPRARFDAAGVLADHGVACVMDISDGLAGDVGHLAQASGITAVLDLCRAPADPEFASFCEKYQMVPADVMAAGGEDYELLFACPPEVFAAICRQLPEAFCVGTCRAYDGESVRGLPETIKGFWHGSDKSAREINP
ncbi:MAG: thiamine-phosphate kinase [Desulfosalsimonas sp.]|uniref:thiamine-phosphate kinase n=1 Tax=Desulfosalsimonas sp. TaxID=3073848 RepID=UPI003970606E